MKPLLICIFSLTAFSLFGLPSYDPFADATGSGGTSYAPGANLSGQVNAQGQSWFQAGGTNPLVTATIQSGSLTIPGLGTSGGNSVLMTPQVNIASRFAFGSAITNGSIYYSFALKVPTIGSTMGAGGGFFAGFNNSGALSQGNSPTVIGDRVLIRSATGGFNLGLSKASSAGSDFQWAGATFTSSDTIFIVGSYDIGTLAATDDAARLWINPSSSDFGAAISPTATLTATTGADFVGTGGSLQSFLLYARANTLFPDQMIIDDLRIGTSWADVTPTTIPEPAVAGLLGLGIVALAYSRKRHS
jgi:PEP-CTERM putative exosortase interaction domain